MRSWEPPARIEWDDQAMLVRIELAGVRPDDIRIEADEGLLVIDGESFCRAMRLPDNVDARAALAILSEGVLTVRIPKRHDTFAA